MQDELLTIDEVAKILKVHRSNVFSLMKNGEFAVVRRGKGYTRILRSDLAAYIQRHRQEAMPEQEAQE